MSKRRATFYKRCEICKINKDLCFCHELNLLDHLTRVSIIMHHREEHLTSNTANLATLTLKNCRIYKRGLKDIPFLVEDLNLKSDYENKILPLYLFPDEEAESLDENFLEKNKGPYHIIIPDGTWGQAKKVKKREAKLSNIMSVKLPENIEGEYKLRKSPRENGVCTFEAIAYAISILESKTICNELLRQFRIMNDLVSWSRSYGS